MTTWEISLYLSANLLVYYTYCRFNRIVLGKARVGAAWEYSAYFLAFFLNSAWNLLGSGVPWKTLIFSISLLACRSFLYRKPLHIRLLISFLLYALMMLMEVIGYCVSQYTQASANETSVPLIFTALIFFFIQLVFERLWGGLTGQPLPRGQWLAIFCVPIGSIVVILVAMRNHYTPESIIVIALLQMGMNVLIFQIYNILGRQYQVEYEKRMLEQQNRAFASQFEIIQKAVEARRALDHDLRNHFSALRTLLAHGAYDEADEYLGKMNDCIEIGQSNIYTGYLKIDCILNLYIEKARDLGAEVAVCAYLPTDMPWALFDLNIIMSNLLNNALEALDRCETRRLEISLQMDRGNLFIEVSNSYDGLLYWGDTGARQLISRKADADQHGIGLKNVQTVVEKYQGSMAVDPEENIFRVRILLPLPI